MTKLMIDFPMSILAGYNGGLSNLDVTLDDNITRIIGKPFTTGFSIESMDRVAAVPGINEELYRYKVTITDQEEAAICASSIIQNLTELDYERGCTIRTEDNVILQSDEHTADIIERRRLKDKKGRN